MKEEYSTLDIVKALKIPRGRLREWIDQNFIIPSVSAEGQGTRAVFTRIDVYGVALFRQLLKLGFSRTMASRITRDFVSREKAQTRGKARYLVFKIGEKNGEPAILTSRVLNRNCNINIETLETHEQEELSQEPATEWDSVIIINFQHLQEETDAALEEG